MTNKRSIASKPMKAVTPPAPAKRRAIPPAIGVNHRVTSNPKKSATFAFDARAGTQVAIAGTFSEWQPQAMTKGQDGMWRITLQLAPGSYQYRFLLDGQWRDDPNNPEKAIDQSRGITSVREVV